MLGEPVEHTITVPPASRRTVHAGDIAAIVNRSFATTIEANVPIVAERAMYWGTTRAGWREAHNSFGVTESGVKWGLAEGRAGGARGYQTYVLISNSTSSPADITLTFIREDGTTIEKTVTAGPRQRLNYNASNLPELANSNFATIVESTNGVAINVESAIYWNVGGVLWEAGGNTVAHAASVTRVSGGVMG